ncbi:MAG: glycosyltransferase family 4 protein [Cyanobacteria bacterium J06626_18]
MLSPALAYISFDIVPAPKGAAVHIAAFVQLLAQEFGSVHLVTVAATEPVPFTIARTQHTSLPAEGATLIHRVLNFRRHLRAWLEGKRFAIIHIRSIYEGYPIAREKDRWCDRLIFEVNGLPSIELPYRYPDVAEDAELQHKLKAQEQICLDAADVIVTPSPITRDHLIRRGVDPGKIQVIPNGVDLSIFQYQAPQIYAASASLTAPNFEVCYFGTLSKWQGVDLAVRALAMVQPRCPTRLTLIGPASKRQANLLDKLATKLGVRDRFTLQAPSTQAALVDQLHRSHCTIAPLTSCDRNLVQGCCPLKVLEGMASGTPVIASDLPVVRALGTPTTHFIPVKPNSVTALAAAWVYLQHHPDYAQRLSTTARHHIEQHFTWAAAGRSLTHLYHTLLP